MDKDIATLINELYAVKGTWKAVADACYKEGVYRNKAYWCRAASGVFMPPYKERNAVRAALNLELEKPEPLTVITEALEHLGNRQVESIKIRTTADPNPDTVIDVTLVTARKFQDKPQSSINTTIRGKTLNFEALRLCLKEAVKAMEELDGEEKEHNEIRC